MMIATTILLTAAGAAIMGGELGSAGAWLTNWQKAQWSSASAVL